MAWQCCIDGLVTVYRVGTLCQSLLCFLIAITCGSFFFLQDLLADLAAMGGIGGAMSPKENLGVQPRSLGAVAPLKQPTFSKKLCGASVRRRSVCRPAVYRTEPPCCIPCAAPPPPPLLSNARLPLLKIALQHTSRKEAARIALFSQLCSKKKTATLLAAPPPPRLLFSRPFSEAHVHANWTIWWI